MDWDSSYVRNLIAQALVEDIGPGDATVAATIPAHPIGAHIVAKQDLVCAGLPLAERIFRALDPDMKLEWHAEEGQLVRKGHDLLHLDGKVSAILTGERTALNFLGRLSGIATLTHQFVEHMPSKSAEVRITGLVSTMPFC